MNRLFKYGVLAVVCAAIAALSSCNGSGGTVYLSDFLGDSVSMDDATPAVRAALEQCRKSGAGKLVLPGGQLRLLPDKAVEKYQFISNNDESLKRIAFDLEGMKDFTIEGNGTELLFSGFISPFSLEGCTNISIENLDIDFVRTFHSEGTVVATGNGWLELSFPENYGCEVTNGILRFRDASKTVYPYASMLEFDVERREPAFHARDMWLWGGGVPAEQLPNGNIRVLRDGATATVGNIIVFGAAARYNPAFTLADCDGVSIVDVNLYHCGGMGVIAQRSRDIELLRLNVTPAPGKGRMISITADATHFVNCGGYIRMIDCVFENQKDDATNIHGLYMSVDSVTGPDKLLLRWRNSGQYGVDFLRKGMTVELVNNRNMETYARRTVASVERINKVFTEVTFTEPLPEGVEPMNVVAADDDYPEVLIKGCRMRGNRARGLLLGSRGKMVIEENYFHIPGAAILFEGDGNYWFEQSGVRDVTIRGNIFENGNYGSPTWGSACIAVGSGIPEREACRYHRNIHVEENTFRVFDPRIVNLYCVDGFYFRNNRIEPTADYPAEWDSAKNFIATNCDNINIEES